MSSTTSSPTATPQAPLAAILWMGGVLLSFIAMAISAREAGEELAAIQLLFYRSLVGITLVVAFAACTSRGVAGLATKRLGAHVVRNCFQFVGQFGWFYAIAMIPLAQVFAIEFTAPLWVGLLAPLVLGERMTKGRLVSLSMGFIGILVVVRPGLVEFNNGTLAILIGALGFAAGMIMTKRLTTTENALQVIFYMSVVQAVLSGPPAMLDPVLPSWTALAWVVMVTIAGLSAHACLVRAFTLADALTIVPIEFLRLPLVMMLAVLLYGEPFDLWILLGGSLILFGNYYNLRSERRAAKRGS